MTDRRVRELLQREAKERAAKKVAPPPDVISLAFPAQKAFITDPARFKVCLCTRRAGKSTGTGIYLIQECLRVPRASVLYLALTKDTARKTMVKDVLDPILEKLRIPFTFNKTSREYTFANGSKLFLAGADASEREMEKVLGQKYLLVVIDESASFSQDLNQLINKLLPAVADLHGSIAMIGTPSNFTANLFYEVTKDSQDTGLWKFFRWSWADNPYVRDEVQEIIRLQTGANPLEVETNPFKQNWLGIWAIDESALCYPASNDNHISVSEWERLKTRHNYLYCLGVDLGWQDHTAFVVIAYSFTDPTAYIVYSENHQHLDFTSVARITHRLNEDYDFVRFMIDGANKQGVEEMKQRHLIPWQSTPKSPGYKFDAIHMCAADLKMLRLRVVKRTDEEALSGKPPVNEELLSEWRKLVWDDKNPKIENQTCKNHLSDAALYGFMASRHYRAVPTVDKPQNEAEMPTAEPRRFYPEPIQIDDFDNPLPWLMTGDDF